MEHCYRCHSTEAGRARGGLKVDTRKGLLDGGDSGPAVVSGSVDQSLLYQALLYHGDGLQMPPAGKLADSVISDFHEWITAGAPDPRDVTVNADVSTEIDIEAGRAFRSYRPINPSEPAVTQSSWPRTTIDSYVSSRQDEQGLVPVDDAPPSVLVRRLYFVMTGLPPSSHEVIDWTSKLEAVTGDERQQVVSTLLDQLLSSPRYGERWGRHWLDVARFAESTGGDRNNIYQHAWRYRDYVVDSFNEDKPFDRFILEQLAGDLLPVDTDAQWAENVIATGFLAIGVKSVGEEDYDKFIADMIDEQIDTTTRAFLATTVACARCHDHKFDPIPQEDYYAMAGIFRSTSTHFGLISAQSRHTTSLLDLTGLGPQPSQTSLDPEELQRLTRERDEARQAVDDAMAQIRSGQNVFRGALRRLRSQRSVAEAALEAYDEDGTARALAMGVQDLDEPVPARLLIRGELDKPAQIVPRGLLQVLTEADQHSIAPEVAGSGRLELAKWIASNDNPLTARVIANRVWYWMFGRGLVRTVDDFGSAGDSPTHPELLDYLATRLIEEDWSIKALIREIAMSRTWQLSSDWNESNFSTDPDNAFLWRMNKRRLEAEAIRDSMLAAAGNLDLTRPNGTFLNVVGEGGVGQNVFVPEIMAIQTNTRSVYLPRVRAVVPEMLETFDAPDSGLVSGARDVTLNPLQSLFLMNNEFVQEQSEGLANRILRLPPEQRLDTAYLMTFARLPSDRERELAMEYVERFARGQQASGQMQGSESQEVRGRRRREAGAGETADDQPEPMSPLAIYCQALLSSMEFQTID
ncbi:MAG: PSD1 and planctomycete cytochrome C domain-containing protein [Planctomycetota bacterium]